MILGTKNFGAPPAISDAPRTPPSQPNAQRNMLLTSCHMLRKSCTSKRVTAASWRSATSNTTGSFRLLHARWHFEPVNSMKRPSSSTRWWRLLLVAALVTAAVVASDVQGQAVAAVDSAAEATTSQVASSEEKAEVPEFVATHEWQELLPGQGIPRGLHVRLNLETGKREAKLVDPDDVAAEEEMRSVVVDPNNNKEATVTVSTDISGEIVPVDADDELIAVPEESAELEVSEEENLDGELNVGEEVEGVEGDEEDETNWNHEKIYEVLQALPEPPQVDGMDIHDAHDKLSPAEFRQQMITLWKKRQIELKEAMESIEDDSKYFARLLDQFYEAEKKEDIPEMLNILEVLEYEVQDLDKTLVFNFIGGFGVMAEYLNSTILPVRAHAAWVVGSAAKNFYDAQNWAIDAGAVPKLISTLNLKVEDDTAAIVEAKKKALYALSAIVRSNERGQRLFLLHSGPDAIAELSNEIYPVNMQQKTLLLAFDLVVESYDHELSEEQKANLVQLRGLFYSTEWCHRFSSFFVAHGSQLPARQAIEMMDALRYQLPACQSVFDAADVKGAVATVGTALAADEEEFDEEERAELALFLEDVQQRLTAGSA